MSFAAKVMKNQKNNPFARCCEIRDFYHRLKSDFMVCFDSKPIHRDIFGGCG